MKASPSRASDLVLEFGGSLSGEHGDGQARIALLEKMYGGELIDAFRQFQRIWDPEGKMNPGKVIDPYPPDTNLKWSPQNYHPATVETHFRYPDDSGSFAAAANRCVGVGKCRREEHGTMCPSYMVTREEIHSTRGRARLLYEMLQGDVVANGWRDQHVHEALDLCWPARAAATSALSTSTWLLTRPNFLLTTMPDGFARDRLIRWD